MKSNSPPTPAVPATTPVSAPGIIQIYMEGFGAHRGLTIGIILFICLIMGGAVAYVVLSAPPRTITITSGPEGSSFQRTAAKYADLLAEHGVKLNILTSHGSEENLQRLSDPSFTVDVGFVQGGVAKMPPPGLVSLGSIAHQPLLVFYRGATVEILSQFSGKRLAVGPVGSGTRDLALTLLGANGIKEGGSTALLDFEPAKASKALLDGTVDAVFLMGEATPTALMRELLHAQDVHLFSFTQASAYSRRFGYLSVLEFPQGCIDLGINLPAHDVALIGPTIELIAREHLHPALSDLLLDAAREVHGKSSLFQHKGEFPAPLDHYFRISADATRFYKSGKTLFYRYLPFGLASLTSRLVLVLVPMLVVSIPVLRSIPFLYRWRIRSRIFRWYRALLALERQLATETDAGRRRQLIERLDEIEKAVNKIKVPTFYADLFYALRGDIDFVRQLSGRQAVASAPKFHDPQPRLGNSASL
jgi:hypothetical protein